MAIDIEQLINMCGMATGKTHICRARRQRHHHMVKLKPHMQAWKW